MAINTDLVISNLDFDTIRANLRTFIAAKPEFTDYDFESSALGTLLDLLAYNTYYNAFYANMATNEGFLDTAQLYDSVVSHAKSLGYTPTSAKSATANVKLIFTSSIANSSFRSITIPKNTGFSATVNGTSYSFVTPQTYTITANTADGFADYITIAEGNILTHRYLFNRSSNTSFVLPNDNVDTRSISVNVTTSGNTVTYIPGNDIFSINSSSKVFFIEADRDKKYKVRFGDGVLGYQPATSSVVSIDYRVCFGKEGDGANDYTLDNGTIDGQGDISVVAIGRSSGGAEIEGIESIRFNAPRIYETQNRTVTKSDYERILLRQYPELDAVSVWGGEENDPPVYGKVFVAAKPIGGTKLSTRRKEEIRLEVRKYNVQSIDIDFTDPTYLYIIPKITVRYDTTQTTATPGELAANIADRVVSFESEYLGKFNLPFRYSRFLDYIDGTNRAIVTSNAIIRLRKTFQPTLTNLETYPINFNNGIQRLGVPELISGVSRHPGYGSVTSSSFQYLGNESYFDDTGFGTLRIYYRSTAGRLGRVYTNFNAGNINYDTGEVRITDFVPTSYIGDSISIVAAPLSPNIKPVRNQIILMSQCEVDVVDDSTNQTLATVNNIETIGQTSTIIIPSVKLYNF